MLRPQVRHHRGMGGEIPTSITEGHRAPSLRAIPHGFEKSQLQKLSVAYVVQFFAHSPHRIYQAPHMLESRVKPEPELDFYLRHDREAKNHRRRK